MIDQEKIHNQCLSDNWEERKETLDKLRDNYSSLSNKQQALSDLIKLSNDQDKSVRSKAFDALESIFSEVPDKQQVWNDLHTLTNDQDRNVRSNVACSLYILFPDLPDKQQALDDLLRLSKDEDSSVRFSATKVLNFLFSEYSSKLQAWANLLRLSRGEDSSVKEYTAETLDYLFSQLPDKPKAWGDLARLSNDEDSSVRSSATEVLDSLFSQFTVTQQAWNDLHILTYNLDWNVRSIAAEILGSLFSQLPDKQQAWDDLVRLSKDEDGYVRSNAAWAFDSALSQVPDKLKAWNDLHTLICDVHWTVRSNVAEVLGSLFSQLHDKEQAWNDLHRLTKDEVSDVRFNAADALGSAFSQVTDKQQAWEDLHRLTNDQDRNVRSNAAWALGISFPYLPDKQQAWDDLLRLTNDVHWNVRTFSNYSLGRVSIFKAYQADKEEDYKRELEKAIEFFEKAPKESSNYLNPSKFCLPFYRSFHAIVFKKKEPKEEVNKYLDEAKAAIEDSESKELLLEAVENLAKALEEVHSIENLDLESKKSELNFYRKYCDRAVELMINSEEVAPYATGVIRKGLPILDRNLKELLEEIQKKTEVIREQTRGTQFEELGDELNQNSQFLLQIRDPVGFKKQVNIIQSTMRAICSKFSEGQKGEACELLKMMYAEPSIEDKIPLMVTILSKFSYQLDMTTQLNRIEERLDIQLNCINFGIFKSELNSHNFILSLNAMKIELEKLNEIESLNTISIEKLNSIQDNKLNNFISDMLERFNEIRYIINEFSKNNNDSNTQELYNEYLRKLDELKQSEYDTILQRTSAFISLVGFVVPMMITLAH